MRLESLALRYDSGRLEILDQRFLPFEERWILVEPAERAIELIQTLAVRGAPLIGVMAAFSLAVFAKSKADLYKQRPEEYQIIFLEFAKNLRSARPTAINLAFAVDRILSHKKFDFESVDYLARNIFEEDRLMSDQLAERGAHLIDDGDCILTHCNTGGLVSAGRGTALAGILEAYRMGKKIHVYASETRPLYQGARLTAWELKRAGISHTIICDSMAAALMAQKKIQKIFVGADRIAQNGDTANKIGTYSHAVLARFHKIPFYVVAPSTTIDLRLESGDQIKIEERNPIEVFGKHASPGSGSYNPAFDVTPFSLVTAIVTDKKLWN